MKYECKYCKEQAASIYELSKDITIKDGMPNVVNINQGIILPRKTGIKDAPYQGAGGVENNDGQLVKESVVYDLINTEDQKQLLAFGQKYHTKNVKASSDKVIYLGLAHQHWGHFLVDVVQRLWFVIQNEERIYNGDLKYYKFAFAGFGNGVTEFKGNFKEFFDLFGLDSSRIAIINEATRFSEIIVPDIAIYPGQYIYREYKQIFTKVIDAAINKAEMNPLPKYDRIYFSRSHLSGNKEMGESTIQDILERCGFKTLYPEELTLHEQIWYWRTAEEIACINGSITHNCVFAKPTLKLFVFNKMSRVVGYQFTMDAVWGNTPTYISAYNEPLKKYPISVSRGPFWIMITNNVERFIHDTYGETCSRKTKIGDYLHYTCLCFMANTKYTFRGSRAKIKNFIRKIV